jgi:hypothetical protein
MISSSLSEEKQRSKGLSAELKQTSEQLRKVELTYEQLVCITRLSCFKIRMQLIHFSPLKCSLFVSTQKMDVGKVEEFKTKLAGKEELCRNLEQQLNDLKQGAVKNESKIGQLKKTISSKDENIGR